LEQAVLDEINTARKNPQKYIKYLEDYKKSFKGKTVYLSKDLLIETVEGTASIDEAIGYLKNLPALGYYDFSVGLNKAAARQLKDLIADSSIGHIGKDGSDLPARIRKFGAVSGKYAENIAYYAPTPRDVVLAMIIDDGIKNRSHRKNIFSPNFKIVGIAFGKSKSSPGLCVVNFAERFYETNTKSGVRQF
jgi:uncharacterized protein YkwD